MNRPLLMRPDNYWMDLRDASRYAGVECNELVDAITTRQVRASTTHPARPGDWMVPLSDVDHWAGLRVPSAADA